MSHQVRRNAKLQSTWIRREHKSAIHERAVSQVSKLDVGIQASYHRADAVSDTLTPRWRGKKQIGTDAGSEHESCPYDGGSGVEASGCPQDSGPGAGSSQPDGEIAACSDSRCTETAVSCAIRR